MSKALRLSEKWFHRGLWLVAFVFAGFLIGLGGTLVRDLPKVEGTLVLDDFLDRNAANALRGTVRSSQQSANEAQTALEQARLKQRVAQSDTQATRASFNAWLATRGATQQSSQDPELVSRTEALDRLYAAERFTRAAVEKQEQAALDAQQTQADAQRRLDILETEAGQRMEGELRRVELRVFLYRLALTLPLLGAAGWLFKTQRRSIYWPFVWGFIFFALFAFFVELVPYLPSYGGYVRYLVGIVVTVVVGRQAIVSLNRYLERQRQAERQPDAQRRVELGYDTALTCMAKGVCPGCERAVDLKNGAVDFCPHCGIGLHDRCGACATRKNAFAPYCHACGAEAGAQPVPTPLAPGPA